MANNLSLAAIGFSIRNQVKGFFSTDDERIDIEFIYKMIKDVRTLLIRDEINTTKAVNNAFYQTISCLELKCRSIVCDGIDSEEKEYYVDIPVLADAGTHTIKYFGSADKKTSFNQRNYQGHLYGNASPWTGNIPYYTIIGGEALMGNVPSDELRFLTLVAILNDPLNGGCFTLSENDPFPISESVVHRLELIVIKQLMATLNIVPDIKNNAANSPVEDAQQPQQNVNR